MRILSVGALLADALGDFFNFDSRIGRSVATLALKPGRLARSFLEGKRARYTPPFRMYVVTSVAFFLVFSLVRAVNSPDEPAIDAIDDVSEELAASAAVEPAEQGAVAEDRSVRISVKDGEWDCNLIDEDTPVRLRERLQAACAEIEGDGTTYPRAFADNVPLMMLVFIPIVAAILRLLYLFAGRKYVDHLLFFLHAHTFWFLTATVALLLSLPMRFAPLEWPLRILVYAALLYFPVYLYVDAPRLRAEPRADGAQIRRARR